MIRPTFALVATLALVAASPSPNPPPMPMHGGMRMPSPPPRANSKASSAPSAAPSAESSGAASGAAFDLGVWTVHASSIDANFKTGEFSTPDKVVMTRVGGDVTADRSDGNYKKQLVNLYGHVVMHDTKGDYGGEAKPGQSNSPSTLTADKAQIDGHAKIYKAIGNVHYVQADTNVTADNGTLNDDTHELDLQGNVHVVQGQRTILADNVRYNTVSGVAHAEGSPPNGVTMEFPGEFTRGLATPRPLHMPKNPVTKPVTPEPAAPPPAVPAPAASP